MVDLFDEVEEQLRSDRYQTLARRVALMQQAGLKATAGKTDEAVSLFDQAAKSAPNPILADLASLRAAELLVDTAPYAQVQQRLLPLADAKRPYTLYAREALAMAKLMAGKTAEARRDFSVLSLSLGVPDDIRQRCQVAINLIDAGQTASAVAAVKIAASMPPPAPASVQPGTPGQGGPVSPPSGAAP